MPLTKKGRAIKAAMVKRYGSKKGEHVFYASRNAGRITGVDHADKLDSILACCDAFDAKHADAHIGFKKLSAELAHEKGVHDPKAVAATIGREKYGAAGMAKKAAAGRRHG